MFPVIENPRQNTAITIAINRTFQLMSFQHAELWESFSKMRTMTECRIFINYHIFMAILVRNDHILLLILRYETITTFIKDGGGWGTLAM